MGGDSYDRPVIRSSNVYSSQANQLLQATSINNLMQPNRLVKNPIVCKNKSPIIFALDVTGSMGDWTKV